MRRLPVYLVLDTSGSMMGDPIAAVEEGVQKMLVALRQDPYALETAYLSVITFNTDAEQIIPLTELTMFQAPSLTATGTTSLGAALRVLSKRINEEIVTTTAEVKGDWKPMVFIMTDGRATDDWRSGLAEYRKAKVGVTVACAVGSGASTDDLKEITEVVVDMATADANSIAAFFKWVSASVSTGSQKVEQGGDIDLGKASELPPPPPEINLVV